ncbi:hypothetical protein C0039_19460 [Pseudohalioglobus lutimaris]|uniref:ATPase dynein-related AAA domain-containing protein n=2 Tax=Pseudohalioglobus lutimaris TaxID=1737061 RepID=A0A2N5WXF3_9GAMM|nr:hypothetical protein C0039_19460 [Pseudohalioglobus lutimaris]
MGTERFKDFVRDPIVDERFGGGNFEAWELFSRAGVSKKDAANALHIIFNALGRGIDEARRVLNTYTTLAYRLSDGALTSDALNNPNYYSEENIFGGLYARPPRITSPESSKIVAALRSDWGAYVGNDLGVDIDKVIDLMNGESNVLVIELTSGAVDNGYIPIPSDQEIFDSAYLGGAKQSDVGREFNLLLPNGESVRTDIRSPSGKGGRIRARFYQLFSELALKPGDTAKIVKLESPGEYSLGFGSVSPVERERNSIEEPTVYLNQILYGPPGTGKTYSTVEKTLEILDPEFLSENRSDRSALRARFERLSSSGQVEFVTFHQSFSYEDFVEGLKASTEDGRIQYTVEDGVFKRLCMPAVRSLDSSSLEAGIQLSGGRYEIRFVGNELVRIFVARTGSIVSFDKSLLEELAASVARGEITTDDIKEKRVFEKTDSKLEKFIVNGYPGILYELVERMISGDSTGPDDVTVPNGRRVLIIDEINRGNIASIFGELITLIEPSKRAGAAESTEVTLPYSKQKFSVPADLYIIGTMNTADRSLVHVDTALRRRFTFIETPPDLSLLADITVEGIDIGRLLGTINDRIELIYDREHRIGHSYFLPLASEPTIERLAEIMGDQVIPLLEEYFFDDWERIQQVLSKSGTELSSFVEPKFDEADVSRILGNSSAQVGTVYQKSSRSLLDPSAYIGIYASQV